MRQQAALRLPFLAAVTMLPAAHGLTKKVTESRAAGSPLAGAARAEPPAAKFIGYYDASAQQELPWRSSLQHADLTHLVVTNAAKVDNTGTVHWRASAHPAELPAVDLIKELTNNSHVKILLSFRGEPDDVALDELAEVTEVREKFTTEAAILARDLGLSGLEIEWHSDDPGGGKAATAPFAAQEQYHFGLLCRDLASLLRAAGGLSLSVAVRPGRQEFASGDFVRKYVDWLTLRAYSMRSLGDPHHSSLKDMAVALGEWADKGVPKSQLVLGTPLFARPGAALHRAGDRNEALRRTWRELAHKGLHASSEVGGDMFRDIETGKTWWVSGLNTTRAKVKHILEHGYGGIAFRDLHYDTQESGLSLVAAALEAQGEFRDQQQRRKMQAITAGVVFMQNSFVRSRSAASSLRELEDEHDEF